MKSANLFAVILFLLTNFSFQSTAQSDESLIAELDSMVSLDQRFRAAYRNVTNFSTDSITTVQVVTAMEAIDSVHYYRLNEMFEEYGFLDYDLVGEKGSSHFWLLVQHQDKHPEFQEAVLAAMKEAVDQKNASELDYAYLLDRVLVNGGQLQVYGTQMSLNADSTSYIPKPVEDPEKLDKRRKKVGLPPISLYIKLMNERHIGNLHQ